MRFGAQHAVRRRLGDVPTQTVLHPGEGEAPSAAKEVEVSLDELLQQVVKDDGSVTADQLASAMRKLLPIMSHADQQLKLGLSKVILHLKNKLNH